jgi:DNA-binding NarL/FixJ family response regulator
MNQKDLPHAIIVEDDRSWQQILSEILTDSGLMVEIADNLSSAVDRLKTNPHRLAIVDLSLVPDNHDNRDGLRVLEAVHRLDPGCQVMLLTGYATVELAVSVLTEYGAFNFIRKENFNRRQFIELIQRALASAPIFTSTPPEPESLPSLASNFDTIKNTGTALVVEDDAGWRSILAEILSDAGYPVRLSGSFGEGLGYLRREKIGLAIIDLSLAGDRESSDSTQELDGYQLLSKTKTMNIPTIVVSGITAPEDIQKAYREQSIFAYVEKRTFNRDSFRKIIEEARALRLATREVELLTEREHQVLKLLAQGKTNKEIAETLIITTNTVKRHVKAIFEKLGIHTRSAAATKAAAAKIDY